MAGSVELKPEDLLRGSAGPSSVEGGDVEGGDLSDWVTTIREFNLEIQGSMDKFMEMLRLVAALRGGGLPGAMPGVTPGMASSTAGHPSPRATGQDPKALILSALEEIKAGAGDVTLLELVNVLVQQYGQLHLSDVINAVNKMG